jgi:hypothetical protein
MTKVVRENGYGYGSILTSERSMLIGVCPIRYNWDGITGKLN